MKRVDNNNVSIIPNFHTFNDLNYIFKILIRGKHFHKKKQLYKAFVTIVGMLMRKKKICVYRSKSFYNKKQAAKYFQPNDGWLQLLENHPYITYQTVTNITNILLENNMITIKKGHCKLEKNISGNLYNSREGEMTTIKLASYSTWNPKLNDSDNAKFFYAPLFNISTYDNTKSTADLIDKSKDKEGNPTNITIKGRDPYFITKLPADHKEQLALDSFNSIYQNENKIFTCNKHFGVTTDDYGRYYGLFDRLPKAIRAKIIKHDKLVELDFNQFIINCFKLYKTGEKFSRDVYIMLIEALDSILLNPEYSKHYRNAIKPICIFLFNNHSKKATTDTIRKELTDSGLLKNSNMTDKKVRCINNIPDDVPLIKFTPQEIIRAAELVFSDIKEYMYRINSTWTQHIESNIMKSLFKFAKNNKHVIFSIHDAVIVPVKYEKIYDQLKEKYLLNEISKFRIKNFLKNNDQIVDYINDHLTAFNIDTFLKKYSCKKNEYIFNVSKISFSFFNNNLITSFFISLFNHYNIILDTYLIDYLFNYFKLFNHLITSPINYYRVLFNTEKDVRLCT